MLCLANSSSLLDSGKVICEAMAIEIFYVIGIHDRRSHLDVLIDLSEVNIVHLTDLS